jgi:hypothetical protein
MSRNLIRTIVAVLLLAALVVVVVPNFIRAHTTSSQNACINNLRQLDGGKQQWALEYRKTTNDIPTLDEHQALY